jgi:hypothetical protein
VNLTTVRQSTSPGNIALAITTWINRSLETLWLLAVVLVPIAFWDPENLLSEAVIAYVEVPKIALLRTLVGLMTILWLVEWSLTGQFPRFLRLRGQDLRSGLRAWYAELAGWLRARPTRWVILAVWTFLGSTLISTVLSGSFSVSLWGEVPGQDGFATYTVVAYVLLFSVIATHLKTPAQLWRLLGAIVAMGVLISGYAVLQHYGHDFLGVLEPTGGGRARATSLMGNAVFAGAAMLLPIPISLLLATITLRKLAETKSIQPQVGPKIKVVAVLGCWVLVLAVQFLGIIFTFSRGPWLGTIFALAGFLILAAIFAGWRSWGWATLALVLAAGLTWAVLQGSGVVSIFSIGPWAGVILALAGILILGALFGGRTIWAKGATRLESSLNRARLGGVINPRIPEWAPWAAGLIAIAAMAAIIVFSPFSNSDVGPGGESSPPSTAGRSAITVQQRFSSITGEVVSGSFSDRGIIWAGSWRLLEEHPWFSFEDLSLPWLRPIIGYGPDLFRYTYLLESTYSGGRYLPLEPDHAHNFFIHQAVEQGIVGLVTSLGIFAAAFLVGGYLLLRKRTEYSDIHQLVLVGLLATLSGRFVEQMVGVARVSDLTIFWALLAAFVALPVVMRSAEPESQNPPQRYSRVTRPWGRRRSRSLAHEYDWQRFWRLAVVAWAVGGIIALTWVKTINYPRAGIGAADAVANFQGGNYQAALANLDRAIDLAPDVPAYYSFKASVYDAYLQNRQVPRERECSFGRDGTPYEICLGEKIYLTNLEAVQQRPFYWRSRLALANSALALGRRAEAIRLYQEAVSMVPASWPLHNRLAEAYIDTGQPQEALEVLEDSLSITGQSSISDQALDLQRTAIQDLEESRSAPEVN